ncbi:NUDIX hydrolase [Chlorobaculum sp. MV4-Y]|uniref:NUDIX hydrolase n=1 Tax=Chlorobaculum sp. MV4-Y TaxID=2976335 RepID=UPI0021AFA6F2|nr:NUDIX hydrolase [Chlorobaculum sp. MV4-Y]UWX56723.1 NUDIX hydrolase [Chlorobaculum sp. MV4-Y]
MKRVGTSIILRNTRNEVLLFLRDDKPEIPYPNHWDLPGGHVEKGETPEACIAREMMEEIETDVSACRRHGIYDFPDRIEYLFILDFDADAKNIPLHEGQRLRWFSEEKIPWKKIAYGFDLVLQDFFAGRQRWDRGGEFQD